MRPAPECRSSMKTKQVGSVLVIAWYDTVLSQDQQTWERSPERTLGF